MVYKLHFKLNCPIKRDNNAHGISTFGSSIISSSHSIFCSEGDLYIYLEFLNAENAETNLIKFRTATMIHSQL